MSDDGWSEGEYQYWTGILHEMEMEANGQLDDEPLTPDSLWVTKDQRRVRVRDMDNNHLLNTIRVLRRKSPIGTQWSGDPVYRRAWLNVMANEAYSRGLTIDEVDEKDPVHE